MKHGHYIFVPLVGAVGAVKKPATTTHNTKKQHLVLL